MKLKEIEKLFDPYILFSPLCVDRDNHIYNFNTKFSNIIGNIEGACKVILSSNKYYDPITNLLPYFNVARIFIIEIELLCGINSTELFETLMKTVYIYLNNITKKCQNKTRSDKEVATFFKFFQHQLRIMDPNVVSIKFLMRINKLME